VAPASGDESCVAGVDGVDHVALTVSDLVISTRFYESLGFSVERHVQFEEPAAEGVTGVADARLRMAFLVFDGLRLELIQFSPKGKRLPPAANDIGSAHICLRVARIADVYADLAARGCEFVSPPYHHPSGVSMTYFADPDGNRLELLEIADGDDR
jgi:lactoylglutathione lyase